MDKRFAARDMPTHFGKVSFQFYPSTKELEVPIEHLPAGGIKYELPIAVNVKLVDKISADI